MKKDKEGNLVGECRNCGHKILVREPEDVIHEEEIEGEIVPYCGADDEGDVCECDTPQLEIDYANITVAEVVELAKQGHEFIFDADERKAVQVLAWQNSQVE